MFTMNTSYPITHRIMPPILKAKTLCWSDMTKITRRKKNTEGVRRAWSSSVIKF